jgi:AraC family transcriptional regulator
MLRPEVCSLQIDGITLERRARDVALVSERGIDVNHVVMQLTSPATLEVHCSSGKQFRRFVPGDIHVIPQGSRVSLYVTGTSDAIMMSFDNWVLARNLAAEDRHGSVPTLVLHLGVRDLQLQCLLSAVEVELKSGCHTGRGYLRQLGAALTSYLTHRYSSATDANAAPNDGLPANRLRTVLDHIHTHLEGSLTVSQLAAMVGMSPQHFANLFRRSTGLAPHRYVLGRRIERAEHLLCTTDLSLAEITLESGFAGQSHFTDVFRKALGITPRRYRTHFMGARDFAKEPLRGIENALAISSSMSESSVKKASGSFGAATSSEQLSISFCGDGLKCG